MKADNLGEIWRAGLREISAHVDAQTVLVSDLPEEEQAALIESLSPNRASELMLGYRTARVLKEDHMRLW